MKDFDCLRGTAKVQYSVRLVINFKGTPPEIILDKALPPSTLEGSAREGNFSFPSESNLRLIVVINGQLESLPAESFDIKLHLEESLITITQVCRICQFHVSLERHLWDWNKQRSHLLPFQSLISSLPNWATKLQSGAGKDDCPLEELRKWRRNLVKQQERRLRPLQLPPKFKLLRDALT